MFVAGNMIFIFPLFCGFKESKDYSRKIFNILLISFLILFFLFELNVRPAVSRILLPALFAAAFFYGRGMERILKKYPRFGNALAVIIILAVIGFAFAETVKFKIAADSWKLYKDDFEWVKSNTETDSIFLIGSQCLPMKIDRKAVFPSTDLDKDTYDYAWVNQKFKLEPQSILSNENMEKLKNRNMILVYSNQKTGTEIYKVIKTK